MLFYFIPGRFHFCQGTWPYVKWHVIPTDTHNRAQAILHRPSANPVAPRRTKWPQVGLSCDLVCVGEAALVTGSPQTLTTQMSYLIEQHSALAFGWPYARVCARVGTRECVSATADRDFSFLSFFFFLLKRKALAVFPKISSWKSTTLNHSVAAMLLKSLLDWIYIVPEINRTVQD